MSTFTYGFTHVSRQACTDYLVRTAALRELHEETGYGTGEAGVGNVEIESVSDVLVKDPG